MEPLLVFLTTPVLGTATWLWLSFLGIVMALLVLDLGILHRDQHEIEMRESLLLYSGYFSVGVLFGLWIWHELGAQSALEFYTGFLVEQSLSMDNVFVMAMIFGFFGIPRRYQHRVLFWGILGVIVLRAIMIGLGTALVGAQGYGAEAAQECLLLRRLDALTDDLHLQAPSQLDGVIQYDPRPLRCLCRQQHGTVDLHHVHRQHL